VNATVSALVASDGGTCFVPQNFVYMYIARACL